MGAIDTVISDALLAHHLDILRLEAGVRARVLSLLNQLQHELIARIATEDLTAFGKARTASLLKQATEVIDSYFARMQGELDLDMTRVAELTASHTAGTITDVFAADLSASLPTATYLERLASNLLIQGAPSAEWWSRQSLDTAFRFANAVRQGILAGDTNETIVARVAGSRGFPGVMDVSRTNARSLVHTSIQAVANEARLETFRKNDDVIESLVWLATLDSLTCELCGARDQLAYTLDDQEPIDHDLSWDGGPGSIHWGCRCVISVQTKTFKELGIDIPEPDAGTRASSDGPVSSDTTFQDFLDRQGAAFQDEYFGEGRAELYRENKLTLEQMMEFGRNPLTLGELEEKYA